MPLKLKNLSDQVIVITGATSAIGSAVALLAADKGAKLILSAACSDSLRDLVSQIRQKNGDAVFVASDVSKIDEVDEVARRALAEFGRIDSWINGDGTAVFKKLLDTSMEEKRAIFDQNFWGVVHGCRAAVRAMKNGCGVIVNVGGVLVDDSPAAQGIYSAVKHAVREYSEALRSELEADKISISIAVVKPASAEDNDLVAKAILNCCESPQREVYVGGVAKVYSMIGTQVPRLTEYLKEKVLTEENGKSAVMAASLGVAAYAAFKVIKNSKKPGEATH